MPANIKYLSSGGQRALKISGGILGGYFVSASFHLMIACFPAVREYAIVISGMTFFLLWAGLMVAGFLFGNGWKLWGAYGLLTLLFTAVIVLLKQNI